MAESSYSIEEVKRAMRNRWGFSVPQLSGISQAYFDGNHHSCPKCGEGKDRFRFTDKDGDGAVICTTCCPVKTGDGFASITWLTGKDFATVLRECAEWAGVSPAKGRNNNPKSAKSKSSSLESTPETPPPFFTPEDWSDILAGIWCMTKQGRGITTEALKSCGAQLGTHYREHVIGIPIYDSSNHPIGHCIYNLTGGTLRAGTGNDIQWVKIKTDWNKACGWIGTVDRLSTADIIWKVEGVSDCLALASVVPPTHAVITNPHGSEGDVGGEHSDAMVAQLANKTVHVIHDADHSGERGAKKWAAAICLVGAASVKIVKLPYLTTATKGKDIRDCLVDDNGSFKSLLELAANPAFTIDITTELAEELADKFANEIHEAVDDPHRLARLNLELYERYFPEAKIKFWKEQFYTWKPGRPFYRPISETELKSKLTAVIRSEFIRVNQEELKKYRAWKKSPDYEKRKDDGPPAVKKISAALVGNTMAAMASMCLISDSIEINTYVEFDAKTNTPTIRERRKWIGLKNHVLDITAFLAGDDEGNCLLPPTPNWFSTTCLPVAFDKSATCPKFERFLETSLEMDPERIKILQEWAGYCLTHDLSQAKFLILEGAGSNGKTVYLSALEALLGRANVSHINLENFAQRFGLVPTIGKLANICGDAGEIDRMAEGLLKAFTDGNPMTIDRKNLSAIEVTPTAKLVLACNNKPRFADRSEGIWRRMMIIPFTREIPEGERITGMKNVDYWEDSGELPGILLWALRGLARYNIQGRFTKSQVSERAANEYRSENNPARAFLKENMEIEPDGELKSSHIYGMYSHWCKSSGYRALSEQMFFKEVRRVFPNVEKKRTLEDKKRFYFYSGINFSTDEISGLPTSALDWPPKSDQRKFF